jgi:hypothetical protein
MPLSLSQFFFTIIQVSLVSKDSSMLDGLEDASIEMDEAKVCFHILMYSTWVLGYERLSSVPLNKPYTYAILALS